MERLTIGDTYYGNDAEKDTNTGFNNGDRFISLDTRATYYFVNDAWIQGDTLLAAGTTSRPPLKFQNGSLLSTPQAGALEFDGSSLEFTPASDRRSIDLTNGVIIASATVTNTVTETTIYTEPISANELYTGSKWHIFASGHYSTANASDTFQMRLKIGGTTIDTITSTAANVSNGFWRVEFFFTIRSVGASGTFIASVEANFNGEDKSIADASTTTIDTTTAEDVTITVEWGNANASNTLTLTQAHTTILGVAQ